MGGERDSSSTSSSSTAEENTPLRSGPTFFQQQLNKGLPEPVATFKLRDNRDPNKVNDEVKIDFSDILAEPEGYHSGKCIWNMSYEIYNWGKLVAYQFFSFIFGIPMSLIWGCTFAIIACLHVWCYAPARRSHTIKMNCWTGFWSVIIASCFDPLFQSAGKVYSSIDVKTEKIIV